jgi:hypothetical protein
VAITPKASAYVNVAIQGRNSSISFSQCEPELLSVLQVKESDTAFEMPLSTKNEVFDLCPEDVSPYLLVGKVRVEEPLKPSSTAFSSPQPRYCNEGRIGSELTKVSWNDQQDTYRLRLHNDNPFTCALNAPLEIFFSDVTAHRIGPKVQFITTAMAHGNKFVLEPKAYVSGTIVVKQVTTLGDDPNSTCEYRLATNLKINGRTNPLVFVPPVPIDDEPICTWEHSQVTVENFQTGIPTIHKPS